MDTLGLQNQLLWLGHYSSCIVTEVVLGSGSVSNMSRMTQLRVVGEH